MAAPCGRPYRVRTYDRLRRGGYGVGMLPAVKSPVDAIARSYADLVCETFPLRATFLGRHERDHELGQHTAATFETFGARIRKLRAELAAAGTDGIDAR